MILGLAHIIQSSIFYLFFSGEPVCELERKRQEFLALEQLNDHLVKSFFGDIDPVEFFKNAPF